jgi:hypothetical protein
VRIPTVALPFVGAAGGLMLAGAAGLIGTGFLLLTGVPPDNALALASWGAVCGSLTGVILGLYRTIDRCLTASPVEGHPLPQPGQQEESPQQAATSRYYAPEATRRREGEWAWEHQCREQTGAESAGASGPGKSESSLVVW